jgi:hypothetical protein
VHSFSAYYKKVAFWWRDPDSQDLLSKRYMVKNSQVKQIEKAWHQWIAYVSRPTRAASIL